jgi:hypothetical protein
MRHVLGVLGVLAASVLLAVSAAMNWQFGYNLGRTPFDGYIYGAASAAADCMKALVPFYFFAAIRNRAWSQAASAFVVWAVVTAYSLTSALGHAALNRADTSGARSVQTQSYEGVRADLKRAQEQLSWVPQHRPAATVLAEIERTKTNKAWGLSENCAKPAGRAETQLCDRHNALQAELGAAQKADTLEVRIAELRAKLESKGGGHGSAEADPQAAVLTALFGKLLPDVRQEDVQTMLTVFVAVLLEVGSGLGMYVAFSQWRIHEVKAPPAPRVAPMAVGPVPMNPASMTTVAVAEKPAVPQLAKPRVGVANDNRLAAAAAATSTLPAVAAAPALPAVAPPVRMVAPESDVERFYKECVVVTDGATVTATELYEDYCAWCETKSKEPLAFPTFGRTFGELGVKKDRIGGRVRYVGIALKSAQQAATAEERKAPALGVQAA